MSEVNGNLTGSTINNYMSSAFNMKNFDWKGATSAGYGMLYNSIPTPHSDLNSSNLESANLRSGISNGLLSAGLQTGNPYVAAAGVAYGVIDKTGGFNDASMSLDSTSNAINKIGSIALPGAGWFLGSTDKYTRSNASKQMASGYLGFDSFANKVELDSGGKFLVGSSKINLNVAKANMMDSSILNIKANRDNDFDAMYSMTLNIGTGNQFALNGGYNSQYAVAAKSGLKLNNLNWAKRLTIGGDLTWAKFNQIAAKNKTIKYFDNLPLKISLVDEKDDKKDKEDVILPEISVNESDETQEDATLKPAELEHEIEISQIEQQSQGIDEETLNFLNTLELDADGNYLVSEDLYNEIMADEVKRKHLEKLGIRIKPITKQSISNVNIHDPHRVVSNKLGGTFNVIPEGALHKNKHHMEDAEGLTKKGIPVVTEENGKYVQLAEIEKEEIIFNLLVTEDLEKLLKEYLNSDNEELKNSLAIEAGKLLTKEILHNTKDMTGLIKEC